MALTLITAWLVVAPAAPVLANDAQLRRMVVSIETTAQRYDWQVPWQAKRPQRRQGSGFVLANGQVLTNAHIVSDARQVIVRRPGEARLYEARVAFIAHDSDLALLTIETETQQFRRHSFHLPLGDLPSLQSRVRIYGFPRGSHQLSRSEGIVSRIAFATYVHSAADSHLAIQTDSAINPGNSGGPVLQENRVVGVVFQANPSLNDVGFFIPTTVVRRFLDDVSDGQYDGFPELGIVQAPLLNPAQRAYLQLSAAQGGVWVRRILPESSAREHVRPGDVLLTIDNVPIAANGDIDYHGQPLPFYQLVEERQVGDVISLTLRREGQPTTVEVPLSTWPGAATRRRRFDEPPAYVVYAGLVFMRLEQAYLNSFKNFWRQAPPAMLEAQFLTALEDPNGTTPLPQNVVLARVLPHASNHSYRHLAPALVKSINRKPALAIETVHCLIASSADEKHSQQLEITLQNGDRLVIGPQAQAAHRDILHQYGIAEASSLKPATCPSLHLL